MTPYEIGILLHYYATCGEHPGAAIFTNTVAGFIEDGLMAMAPIAENRAYKLTEMGQFYVEHGLCKVPLPVSKFEIPER